MTKKNPVSIPQQIAAPVQNNGVTKKYIPQVDPDEKQTVLDGVRGKVFLDRYALKDKEGNLMENYPEQMWKRVAWGISQSEKPKVRKFWEEKFYEVMKDFKFVPAGRILSGAGTEFQVTYFNCLPPDQEILTPSGYKPIGDIKEGDLVITGKKRARLVNKVFVRDAQELMYHIKPKKIGFDDVRLTGEHPVLAIRDEWVNTHRSRDGLKLKQEPQWIKASELKEGDFVAVGWDAEVQLKEQIKLTEHLSENFETRGSRLTHQINTSIPIGFQATFNKAQLSWVNEATAIIQGKLAAVPSVRESQWSQWSQGFIQSRELPKYIYNEERTNPYHDQNYSLAHDDLYWVRIDSIKTTEYQGKVFDIEVEEDHSFITGGVVVSNCFVIPSPKDSRDGILESLKQLVEIQSRSGGVGLNLSSLRPRGARVKKVNGVSSGPITWAGLFSYVTHDVVQQGGSRRGATMIMLHDWHPDIEEFITVKQDLTKINGANLSVCVSDSFMQAVKEDKDWDLVYPDLDDPDYDSKWDGELDEWLAEGKQVKVYKTVKAKYLWDLICEAAWRSAEPGLHFLERSNKRSNTHYFEKLSATNPSLRAGTKVLTKEGIFPIESLDKKRFYVKNLDGEWSLAECFLSGKNKTLYKIILNNGREVFATAEHKWPVLLVGGGFGKVTTDRLKSGNILPFPKAGNIQFNNDNKLSKEQGFMLGWLYGDGWITQRGKKGSEPISHLKLESGYGYDGSQLLRHMISGGGALVSRSAQPMKPYFVDKFRLNTLTDLSFGFLFSEEDKSLANVVLEEVNKLKKEKSSLTRAGDNTYTIQTTSAVFADNLFKVFGVNKKDQGLPSSIWDSGSEFIKGFIDGLFSSDGFVSKKIRRVVFTTKHKKVAEDLNDLLSFFGVKSTIRYQESTSVKFPNGKKYYKTYKRYDVSIDGYNSVNFAKIFTLSHQRKQQNLLKMVSEYAPSRKEADLGVIRIASIEKTDLKEDVWDVSVFDETHCFYINHCITGNCGEQPLGPWAVCNLGAMNLAQYVKDEQFEYQRFGDDVKVAMRFLDNVIDETYYFFPENEKCAKDIRRTGLGIMGLADALIMMKIKYGSDESLPVIHNIFKTLRDNAYVASSDMALEKGVFPKFDKEKYLEGYHIKNLPDDIQQKIADQGIRNAVLLTIAPTGTTSLVSGVSSGVEPVYEFELIRRDRIGEHKMYHPLYEAWKESHPGEVRPEYFVSANDLTPLEHVRVQAVAQEYIDSSISKTVNAPNSHTVDDVKNLYMTAYDMGLKGVTYMREGSRAGVLSRVEEKKEPAEVQSPAIPQRPMVLHGRTYKMMTPLGEAFITINRDENNEPVELFATIGKAGMHVGADAEAIGRLVSLALKSNPGNRTQIAEKIIHNLRGIGGASQVGFGKDRVMSLGDAIAKVLAEDLANNNSEHPETLPLAITPEVQASTNGLAHEGQLSILSPTQQKSKVADLCPECGNAALVFEEGCKKCYSCGYSAC